MSRLVILGNSGSGKTTLARRLAARGESVFVQDGLPADGAPVLSLDAVAFVDGTPERRPLADSVAELARFADAHDAWVVEGCFGDLAEAALARADGLLFLNPGVEACLAHCRARPWERDKFPTRQAQDALLAGLLDWVARYDERDDEYGLRRHRAVFDAFAGPKRELTDPARYDADAASL